MSADPATPSTFVRIGRFVLDVSLTESHSFETEVTDYPVESGGSISDNIRPKPLKVTIEGIVTNTPLTSNAVNKPTTFQDPYTNQEIESVADAFTFAFEAARTAANDANANDVKFLRSEQAYEYLKGVAEARETVIIRTSIGTFNNMAMTSLEIPRSKETTGLLRFTATFQQIQIVENARTRKRVSVRNGNGNKDRGTKPSTAPGWNSDAVLWRQGLPPGSFKIVNAVVVKFVAGVFIGGSEASDEDASAAGHWVYVSGPRAAAPAYATVPAALATLGISTGVKSYLTTAEVANLEKDLQRDRLYKDPPGLSFPTHGEAATLFSPVRPIGASHVAEDPKFTKKPMMNLSDQNRKASERQSGAPNFSGDPDFSNKGNFNSFKAPKF